MSNCANMPRICSKRAATSCPFFSPASVSTMKWSELIRSHCWSAADVGSVRQGTRRTTIRNRRSVRVGSIARSTEEIKTFRMLSRSEVPSGLMGLSLYCVGTRLLIWGSLLRGYHRLFKQKPGSVGQAKIVRDTFKISMKLFLLYREGFEQKRFASHIHCHLGHFPIARNDLRAFYGELAALRAVSQQ